MSTKTHRIPAGDAGGALAGMYPNAISIGCPPLAGWSLWDDFTREGSAGDFGESRLTAHPIGSGIVPAAQSPAANTEIGILRITTDVSSTTNEGGSLGLPTTPGVYAGGLPGGLWYIAKLRLIDTADIQCWSGFVEDHRRIFDGGPDGFVGFWAQGGGNWKGVVYDGTTWQEVDLGVAADSTWRILAFRIPAKCMATTDQPYGIQFSTVNGNVPPGQGPEFFNVGNILPMSGVPSGGLTLAAGGVVTLNTVTPDRTMEVDFVGVGGPGRR